MTASMAVIHSRMSTGVPRKEGGRWEGERREREEGEREEGGREEGGGRKGFKGLLLILHLMAFSLFDEFVFSTYYANKLPRSVDKLAVPQT